MKILLLTSHLNYGGISSYAFFLAKTLTKLGHDVFFSSAAGDLIGQLKKNDVKFIHMPSHIKSELNPLNIVCLLKLIMFMKKESVDIIHAQTRITQVLAEQLSKITKVPYVSTCHGFFRRNLGRIISPCWGTKVIAISEAVKKHLMIDFYVPAEKIALVPNGINIKQFKVSSKRTDIKHTDRTVGIIARLSTIKGHSYLIDAMVQVLEEFSNARLFIFGQGNIKYELIKQAKKLKIDDKIFFLPAVSNTAEILQEVDIFVMPSLQEGLGLSILEAQACSVPVIASNVGGIPSIVKHDVTGLLVPPKDSSALAGAIMRLMEDRELAIRLGQRARYEVENKFNLETMTNKIVQVYEEVLRR